MLGFGTPIGSHRSPGESCYEDLSGYYPYDPAKARALLQEAGYGPNNPLRFTFTLAAPSPYERRLGEAIAAPLSQIGVQARLEVVGRNFLELPLEAFQLEDEAGCLGYRVSPA